MDHIVQKQTFELSVSGTKLMHAWERRVQDILRDVINKATEKCFDTMSHADEIVLIDRLEIDLGVLNTLSAAEIADRVTTSLLRQLQQKKNDGSRSVVPAHPVVNVQPETILQTWDRQSTQIQIFRHFLVHGRLPWWALSRSEELSGDWMENLTVPQAERIANTLLTHRHTIARFVLQLDDRLIFQWMQKMDGMMSRNIAQGWNILNRMFSNQPSNPLFRTQYWTYWTQWLLGINETPIYLNELFRACLEQCSVAARAQYVGIITGIIPGHGVYAVQEILLSDEERTALRAVTLPWWSIMLTESGEREFRNIRKYNDTDIEGEDTDNGNKPLRQEHTPTEEHTAVVEADSADIKYKTTGDEPEQDKESTKNKTDLIAEKTRQQKPATKLYEDMSTHLSREERDTVFVEAAGLVLVHPFLTELFTSAGLWQNRAWTSAGAQHQAVQLMTWLVWGNATVPEYRQLLPKLLCGMPWEEPLDTQTPLSTQQLDVAAALLEAVISHWPVLGNTSIDGLREGFIHREGKLMQRDDGWQLTVESKAQDILMKKLPWGLSLVHLPWLGKTRLHVDWNY